jgi:hypothetical protein
MLITPEYKKLQENFHLERPDYGQSGRHHVEIVLNFAEKLKTRDILDYGAGKGTLQKGLPFPIQNYDPCMPEYATRPVPANLVVCTDVLEHIESECLSAVLDDLCSLTKQVLYLNVATGPAKKFLPDGRNAHLLQENANWWLTWLLPRFNLQSFQANEGNFTALLTPFKQVQNDAS